MRAIPGTTEDYQAVADYWNSFVGKEDSIWRFSPIVNAEHIGKKVDKGFSLYVLYEDGQLIGYGMWKKEYMLGIAAKDKETYWRIGREWVEQNLAAVGRVRFPNIVCNEISWLEELTPVNREPESYKPLKPGEDISKRKVWTYQATFRLDAVKDALDKNLGE
ncbi:MAG: hypothetical protein DWQ19_10520 [Crenarchaeota archaeon]|mgnify:CR=1 FL=1|nr:MAG: hypothetical protein DWQ19_10520 [Thermoproteota archaeon]